MGATDRISRPIPITFAKEVLRSLQTLPIRDVASNTSKRKYPAKSGINESNIYEILIKDCLPYGKHIFEGDIIRDINLDLNKLNEILAENYSLKPLTYGNIMSMRFKDLKALLLSRLSK
jgi:hypothetical protein